ncbi:G protein-coupled receptor, class C, group 5, member Ba [Engraulis encrasicolus]|uniref:G protein-coupled receptor, class C, group 5, member Ba n=1 Tax=Engraulis encrasicolus TaxID=184585 RepID=UPI002FCF7A7A
MLCSSVFLLLLCVSMGVGVANAQEEVWPTGVPWGCGFGGVGRPYTRLCDLELVWGVCVEATAVGGALAAILLGVVLLCRLRAVGEAEKRSGAGPILLLLLGIVGLFGLSVAFVVESSESVCVIRRALWGVAFALCFSCLLVQAVRLRRITRERRSPSGCALSGLAAGLTGVQGIIAAEWLLLTVLRQGQAACDFEREDLALSCCYVLALLLVATVIAGACLCGGAHSRASHWRSSALWLLASCLLSLLLWGAWLTFYIYGNQALEMYFYGDEAKGAKDWEEPTLAITLVAQGWLLLLCHAVPEAHACMRPPPQPSAPDYFDTTNTHTRLRQTSYDDDIPLSHRQFNDAQGYAFDDSNAAGLRTGGSHASSSSGTRPSAPFRSNVYQPTEMTMILNGGAVPSAPPTYTGRQLW